MKKLITLIVLIILSSCGPSREEFEARDKEKKDSTSQVMIQSGDGNVEITNSVKSYNSNDDFRIGIYQVNGCEYIAFTNDKCTSVIHSGNCNNKIHETDNELKQDSDFKIN